MGLSGWSGIWFGKEDALCKLRCGSSLLAYDSLRDVMQPWTWRVGQAHTHARTHLHKPQNHILVLARRPPSSYHERALFTIASSITAYARFSHIRRYTLLLTVSYFHIWHALSHLHILGGNNIPAHHHFQHRETSLSFFSLHTSLSLAFQGLIIHSSGRSGSTNGLAALLLICRFLNYLSFVTTAYLTGLWGVQQFLITFLT